MAGCGTMLNLTPNWTCSGIQTKYGSARDVAKQCLLPYWHIMSWVMQQGDVMPHRPFKR